MTERDKHTSFSWYEINYDRKKVYSKGHRMLNGIPGEWVPYFPFHSRTVAADINPINMLIIALV